MTDDSYARLIRLIERHGAELNQFLSDIRPEASESDFHKLRTIVGHLMGNGHYAAFYELVAERPDLKPNWMDA